MYCECNPERACKYDVNGLKFLQQEAGLRVLSKNFNRRYNPPQSLSYVGNPNFRAFLSEAPGGAVIQGEGGARWGPLNYLCSLIPDATAARAPFPPGGNQLIVYRQQGSVYKPECPENTAARSAPDESEPELETEDSRFSIEPQDDEYYMCNPSWCDLECSDCEDYDSEEEESQRKPAIGSKLWSRLRNFKAKRLQNNEPRRPKECKPPRPKPKWCPLKILESITPKPGSCSHLHHLRPSMSGQETETTDVMIDTNIVRRPVAVPATPMQKEVSPRNLSPKNLSPRREPSEIDSSRRRSKSSSRKYSSGVESRSPSCKRDRAYLQELEKRNRSRSQTKSPKRAEERKKMGRCRDDDQLFLMSLLPAFKKVDYDRKMVLRCKVQELIVRETVGPSKKSETRCRMQRRDESKAHVRDEKPVVKEEPKPVVKDKPKQVVKEEAKPVVKEEPLTKQERSRTRSKDASDPGTEPVAAKVKSEFSNESLYGECIPCNPRNEPKLPPKVSPAQNTPIKHAAVKSQRRDSKCETSTSRGKSGHRQKSRERSGSDLEARLAEACSGSFTGVRIKSKKPSTCKTPSNTGIKSRFDAFLECDSASTTSSSEYCMPELMHTCSLGCIQKRMK